MKFIQFQVCHQHAILAGRKRDYTHRLSVAIAFALVNGYCFGQQSGQAASEIPAGPDGSQTSNSLLAQTPLLPVFPQGLSYRQYTAPATPLGRAGGFAFPALQVSPLNWQTAPAMPLSFPENTPRSVLSRDVSASRSLPAVGRSQSQQSTASGPWQAYAASRYFQPVPAATPSRSQGQVSFRSPQALPAWISTPSQPSSAYRPQPSVFYQPQPSVSYQPQFSSPSPSAYSPLLPADPRAGAFARDSFGSVTASPAVVSTPVVSTVPASITSSAPSPGAPSHNVPSSISAIARAGGFRTFIYRSDQVRIVTLDSNSTPETDEWDPYVQFDPSGYVSLSNPQEAGTVTVRIFAGEDILIDILLDGLQTHTLNLVEYLGENLRVEMRYSTHNNF